MEISAKSPDYPIEIDSKSFETALDEYQFLVVDFWAEWCMPCHMVHPVIESLAKKYKGNVTFARLNIDENMDIATSFGIMSIPTLVIFKNGKELNRVIGALPEKELEQEIRVYL